MFCHSHVDPEHPKWLNKTELTSSSTIVEWGRPDAGSYDGFRLTLLTSGQNPVYVNLNMSEMRHQFSSLQPATRYTVKVAARADTVYSSPVDLIFTTSTWLPPFYFISFKPALGFLFFFLLDILINSNCFNMMDIAL